MNKMQYYGTGKRKTSIARVYVRPGNGRILVNRKPVEEYFGTDTERNMVRQPLEVTETSDRFDVVARVRGGGFTGQATAIRHGLARALTLVAEEEYRGPLKRAGHLTRDARKVERKKYGQPGARKRFQYSKR